MNTKILPRSGPRGFLGGVILGLMLVAPLAAQSRLYVLGPGDNYFPVRKVSGGRPMILENNKLVPVAGKSFALRKVEEYWPVFIAVREMTATTSGQNPLDIGELGARVFSSTFHFSAKFESAYPLQDVFLVLELETANAGRNIFVCEIGRLEAGSPSPFVVELPLEQNLGPGQIKLHLFVDGEEVFQSEQPASYRAEMLDQMIARRITAVRQADPRLFFGAAPGYPAALRKIGARGLAVVTMRITPQGAVVDPVVTSASEPAFGEEALKAVREWRFLPCVRDGRAVESVVRIPFDFTPPAEPAARTP